MLPRPATPRFHHQRSAFRWYLAPLATAALVATVTLGSLDGRSVRAAEPVAAQSTTIARSELQAPEAIQQAIAQWEAAANAKDLRALLQNYSANYRNSDGLNRRTLATSIQGFWKQYSDVTYEAEIADWEPTRRGGIAEVVTRIQGRRSEELRRLTLATTFRSRQTYENGQLVREEILSERSEITSGDRPPTLRINLPSQVTPGQKYNLDVIVVEPVETDLLLGGLLDEPVTPKGYGTPSQAELAPLIDAQLGTGPGGMFKIGEAPRRNGDRWISAVVMRKDGLTMVTQRLKVKKR